MVTDIICLLQVSNWANERCPTYICSTPLHWAEEGPNKILKECFCVTIGVTFFCFLKLIFFFAFGEALNNLTRRKKSNVESALSLFIFCLLTWRGVGRVISIRNRERNKYGIGSGTLLWAGLGHQLLFATEASTRGVSEVPRRRPRCEKSSKNRKPRLCRIAHHQRLPRSLQKQGTVNISATNYKNPPSLPPTVYCIVVAMVICPLSVPLSE